VRVPAEDRNGCVRVPGARERYRHPVALTDVHLGGPALDRRAWWEWNGLPPVDLDGGDLSRDDAPAGITV
jgi:hypothetical protein